jgi:hypothetical protein
LDAARDAAGDVCASSVERVQNSGG